MDNIQTKNYRQVQWSIYAISFLKHKVKIYLQKKHKVEMMCLELYVKL